MDHGARLKLFDALMAGHRPFLEAILWRMTGDRELFAEALQESLLQIWRHVEKLEGPAGRSYLYRIAQSASAMAWRKRAAAGPDAPEDVQGLAAPPENHAVAGEWAVMVRRAISELPEQQGRAITMRYLEQKDYEVMARETDCSEPTLRSHVSKALAALRNRLAPIADDLRTR